MIPPGVDGGADAQAPVDAGVDADVDAGPPRECSDDGFCQTALPPKETLRGVWSDGAGTTWAVADSGSVLRYDGHAWTEQAKLDGALSSVWGSGPTDLWVGGANGIYHGQGASSATLVFTDVATPGDTRAPITSFYGTGPDDVWAAGGYNTSPKVSRILHYTGADTDAGAAWTEPERLPIDVYTTRIWGSPATGLWIGGVTLRRPSLATQTVVLNRAPGSDTFVEIPVPGDPSGFGQGGLNKFFDGSMSADGSVWLLGRTDTSLAGYDLGTNAGDAGFAFSFTSTGPVTPDPVMNAIWGSSATDAWMAGDYGRLRHWDGTAWTQAKIAITKYPVIAPFYAIWGSGTTDLWVVGDGIALHRDTTKKGTP
jgi:hypothetical protein